VGKTLIIYPYSKEDTIIEHYRILHNFPIILIKGINIIDLHINDPYYMYNTPVVLTSKHGFIYGLDDEHTQS